MNLFPRNTTSHQSIRTLKYIFSAIVGVLVVISIFTYISFLNYGEDVKWRVHSDKIIRALQEIEVEVLNAEVGHRGYQLTHNPEYLEPYLLSKDSIQDKVTQINDLVDVDTKQQSRVDSLLHLITRQYAIIDEIISVVEQYEDENAGFTDYEINLLAFGRQNMEKIRNLIVEIEIAEKETLNQRISQQEDQSRLVPVLFIISNLLALAIIIYVFFYTYRLLKIRTTTEEELREKQIQLLEAERMVNMGHWSWNMEDDRLEWSDGLYQIYEKPVTFKPDYDTFVNHVHPDDRKEVLNTLDDAVKNKKGYDINFRKKLENGKIKNVHSIGNPKIDFNGNLLGFFGVTQDITQQRSYENQILMQSEELKRSNMDLEQFAYVASHDLQEPLRKIRAFGDRLKTKYADKLEETGTDYINRMQNAAERMQVLINDLLTFSRVSRKDQEFKKHDLTNILEEVLDDLETKINDTKAQINYDQLPTITCNYLEMKRLFQNIIGNALKFQKPGEPPVITVKGESTTTDSMEEIVPHKGNRKYVRLSFKDEGIGFDKKHEEKIFNIFQRLHGRSQYKGTGIGLAICRKIVANHEGIILAKGEENKGSEFIIVIPKNQNRANNHERTKKIASDINGR